jgi:hypothetical protein
VIEYRNDFFLLSLQLSSKRSYSKLAPRFVHRLVIASEILERKFDSFLKSSTNAHHAQHFPCLTAGLSLHYAFPLRVPLTAAKSKLQEQPQPQDSSQSNSFSTVRPLQVLGPVFSRAVRNERIINNLVFGNGAKGASTSDFKDSPQQQLASLPLSHAICYDVRTHRALQLLALKIDDAEALRGMNRTTVPLDSDQAPQLVRLISSSSSRNSLLTAAATQKAEHENDETIPSTSLAAATSNEGDCTSSTTLSQQRKRSYDDSLMSTHAAGSCGVGAANKSNNNNPPTPKNILFQDAASALPYCVRVTSASDIENDVMMMGSSSEMSSSGGGATENFHGAKKNSKKK